MTKVVFKIFEGEVVAIFPDFVADFKGNLSCYAHFGQHSGCSPELLNCPNATVEQYQDLLDELSSYPYRYNCEILNEN